MDDIHSDSLISSLSALEESLLEEQVNIENVQRDTLFTERIVRQRRTRNCKIYLLIESHLNVFHVNTTVPREAPCQILFFHPVDFEEFRYEGSVTCSGDVTAEQRGILRGYLQDHVFPMGRRRLNADDFCLYLKLLFPGGERRIYEVILRKTALRHENDGNLVVEEL